MLAQEKEAIGFNIECVLCEEPCTDPYARFCGQTEAAASSDPMEHLGIKNPAKPSNLRGYNSA